MGGMGMDTPLCWQPTRGMWGSMIYTQRGGGVKTHMLMNANTLLHTGSLKRTVKIYTHAHTNACTLGSLPHLSFHENQDSLQ